MAKRRGLPSSVTLTRLPTSLPVPWSKAPMSKEKIGGGGVKEEDNDEGKDGDEDEREEGGVLEERTRFLVGALGDGEHQGRGSSLNEGRGEGENEEEDNDELHLESVDWMRLVKAEEEEEEEKESRKTAESVGELGVGRGWEQAEVRQTKEIDKYKMNKNMKSSVQGAEQTVLTEGRARAREEDTLTQARGNRLERPVVQPPETSTGPRKSP